jgi:predicted ATP-dependent endonuclease of OLD family
LRLWRIDIDQFRSIEDQSIPAEGLVVLFGMNSAGKTSVLEAVEGVISQTASFRADPGAQDDPVVLGSVILSLSAANMTGSDDARLYLSLLRGDFSKSGIFGEPRQYPWDWLDDQHRESLENLDLHQTRTILADSLAASGNAGSAEDRKKLASSVFDLHRYISRLIAPA